MDLAFLSLLFCILSLRSFLFRRTTASDTIKRRRATQHFNQTPLLSNNLVCAEFEASKCDGGENRMMHESAFAGDTTRQ